MSHSDFLSIPSSQPRTLLTSASSGLLHTCPNYLWKTSTIFFFLWNKPLQSFLQWEFHKSSFKLFHFQTNQVLCNHSSIIRTFSSLLTEFIFLLAPYHRTFSHIQQSTFIKCIDNNKEKKLSRHKCHVNLSYSRLRQEK
jgi:hypothetical protein